MCGDGGRPLAARDKVGVEADPIDAREQSSPGARTLGGRDGDCGRGRGSNRKRAPIMDPPTLPGTAPPELERDTCWLRTGHSCQSLAQSQTPWQQQDYRQPQIAPETDQKQSKLPAFTAVPVVTRAPTPAPVPAPTSKVAVVPAAVRLRTPGPDYHLQSSECKAQWHGTSP